MLEDGTIRPSNSPYFFRVVSVSKTDNTLKTTLWFYVDYRALNNITIKDNYPTPVIDELLDELQASKRISKMDLRSGYHQMCMHEDDIQKIAFRTH